MLSRNGLSNESGSNNCFLNVILQPICRLSSSEDFFSSQDKNRPIDGNNLFDSLSNLYFAYKFSEEEVLPPNQVRLALSECFSSLKRFRLGEMDDAVEVFEHILIGLHGINNEIDSPCENRNCCLGHTNFAFDYCEKVSCLNCGKINETTQKTDFTFRLYVLELLGLIEPDFDITDIMNLLFTQERECINCHAIQLRTEIFVLSFPKVFTISLIYPQEFKDFDFFSKLFGDQEIDLKTCFNFPSDEDTNTKYLLSGIVCYYPGNHYVFFGRTGGIWSLFDDSIVKQVGSISQVWNKCNLAHYRPVLLFFEHPAPTDHILLNFFSM